ncbi:GerMN domain-containing protein [Defluviitalea phaphyphila]|uniref:GerMN domain-containing protein n=1 Tax=Defluviitalea phaphyphila TaxID=1473580 RepID=UPI00072FF31C|nr:GerMN domain-containing protein [Defluviitalea phaphyphila]
MNETTYLFILVFMGLMFVSPALTEQITYVNNYEMKKPEEKVGKELTSFFENTTDKENLIPENTKLINVTFQDGHLILNISKEIKNYGGTLTEEWIIDKILSIGFSANDVNSITILIEGEKDYFPEGTIIDSYKKEDWLKRKEEK